jgi:prepilin-type processing-associated H-X9-DG protein
MLLVGEQSDWGIDPATGAQVDIRNSAYHGIFNGTDSRGTPPNMSTISGDTYFGRTFNLTTIRYAIGTKDATLPGVCNNMGVNNPLQSAHPGGIHALFADGSGHFLAEELDLLTLKRLSVRDDGQVIDVAP